ncbi:uncharacterized protein METZ01_LOCUS120575, partial [marine metagenome]
ASTRSSRRMKSRPDSTRSDQATSAASRAIFFSRSASASRSSARLRAIVVCVNYSNF